MHCVCVRETEVEEVVEVMGKLCSVSVKRKVKGVRRQEGVRAKNKKWNSACSLFNRGEGDEDNEQNHWAMDAGTAPTYLLTHTYSYIYTHLFTLQRTCFATWNPTVTACINTLTFCIKMVDSRDESPSDHRLYADTVVTYQAQKCALVASTGPPGSCEVSLFCFDVLYF